MNIRDSYIHGKDGKGVVKRLFFATAADVAANSDLHVNDLVFLLADTLETQVPLTIPTLNQNTTGYATSLMTVKSTSANNHYLTFVDSNNPTADAESFYTSGDIYFKPSTGVLTVKSVTVSNTFNYSGIGSDTTSNAARKIWFASSSDGTPVVSDNFKYNPSTKTLTVDKISGPTIVIGNTTLYLDGANNVLTPDTVINNTSTDNTIPSSKAVWDAILTGMQANDAMVFKGFLTGGADAVHTTYTPGADRGDTYKVQTAGYINGEYYQVNDTFICTTDGTVAATSSTSAADMATIKASWGVVEGNGDYLNINGGTMYGTLSWDGTAALPTVTTASNILVVDNNTTKQISLTNLLTALNLAPSISNGTADNTVKITVGGIDSSDYTVPYASNSNKLDNLDSTEFIRIVTINKAVAKNANEYILANTLYNSSGDLNSVANYTSIGWDNFPTRRPDGGWWLLNINQNSAYKHQIYSCYLDNHLYIRSLTHNGTNNSDNWWNAWQKVALIADLPSTKNMNINGTNYAIYTSASSLPTFVAPASLAETGGYILATNSNKTALEWVAKPTSNVTTSAVVANAANSTTQINANQTDPYYNLIEGGSIARSIQFKHGDNMTIISTKEGVITFSATNTWRSIYVGGSLKATTAINTKAMNFASSNLDITYLAAGTGTGKSGNDAYFTINLEAKNWSGATSEAAGTAGYMPGATSALRGQFLRGDGSWVDLSLTDHTHSVKINGSTKTIAAPGGTAVDLGRYVVWSSSTGSTASKIYDINCGQIFTGSAFTDGPVTNGWISGIAFASNWDNNHYQHYLVENGNRWYTTRTYTDRAMDKWYTFAYLSDIVANAVGVAGYVAAPTKASNPNQVWMTNSDGAPAWRTINVATAATLLAKVTKTLAVSTWTNMAAINSYTGTYAIQISSGNVYASGVFTACGGTDSVIDEIPLHVSDKGTNTWRPYARISGTNLQMTTNETTGTSREYTIKILKLI